jgi:putative endonuclease
VGSSPSSGTTLRLAAPACGWQATFIELAAEAFECQAVGVSVHVYILHSRKLGLFYVGHTDDMNRRLDEHNSGRSTWTARADDWEVCMTKPFQSRVEAARLEKRIKKTGAKAYLCKCGLVTRSEA